MNGSIRLHPEHGVNPALGICFFCRKEDGTLLLLGHNKGKEAPRHVVHTAEPCDKCKADMAKGIALIECEQSDKEGTLQIGANAWATGRWCVMTEDWISRTLISPMREQVLKVRKAFVDVDFFTGLMKAHNQTEDKG